MSIIIESGYPIQITLSKILLIEYVKKRFIPSIATTLIENIDEYSEHVESKIGGYFDSKIVRQEMDDIFVSALQDYSDVEKWSKETIDAAHKEIRDYDVITWWSNIPEKDKKITQRFELQVGPEMTSFKCNTCLDHPIGWAKHTRISVQEVMYALTSHLKVHHNYEEDEDEDDKA